MKNPKKGTRVHDRTKTKKKKISKIERLNREIAGLRAAVAVRDNKISELMDRLPPEPGTHADVIIKDLKGELVKCKAELEKGKKEALKWPPCNL